MKLASIIALSSALCQAALHKRADGAAKAIYFLRVNPKGSSVVSIAVDSQGQLVRSPQPLSISTGGFGLQSQNYSTPDLVPVDFDPLQGQQSVSVGRNYLFTVNSGSNTAVMFRINPNNPLELTMVGKPVATLGQFPMSIAYSSKYNKTCVLNGGAKNGVACYSVTSKGLVADGVGLRSYGFPATTPPQLLGPKGSGSDVQFSIDSSKLITTFKGTNQTGALGHVTVFDVDEDGNVAATFTDNRKSPISVPFGYALNGIDKKQLFISDVAFGGGNLVSLDYNTDRISVLSTVNSSTLLVSCWAVWSSTTGSFYVIDAGSTTIGQIDTAGNLVRTLTYNSQLGGGLDTVVNGRLAYFLTHVNTIAAIDLVTGQLVQRFNYSTLQNRPFWTGMATFPASDYLTGGVSGLGIDIGIDI